jgi:hypothetical protein
MVKAQKISEHAKLKGSTNVICRFNEEAERHCKSASVSAEPLPCRAELSLRAGLGCRAVRKQTGHRRWTPRSALSGSAAAHQVPGSRSML